MERLTPDQITKARNAYEMQEHLELATSAFPKETVTAALRRDLFDFAVAGRRLGDVIEEQEVFAAMFAAAIDLVLGERSAVSIMQAELAAALPLNEAREYEVEALRSAVAIIGVREYSREDYDFLRRTTPEHQLAFGMTRAGTLLLQARTHLLEVTGH